MDYHIRKQHNVSLLIYHFVCPAKYRRDIFTEEVESTMINICKQIELSYEIRFDEIGADMNHVHFLIQSIPTNTPSKIIQTVKSILARELFAAHPEIKKKLWKGQLWTRGYYVNTVGNFGGYDTIKNYVHNQGSDYKTLHKNPNIGIGLFEGMVFS